MNELSKLTMGVVTGVDKSKQEEKRRQALASMAERLGVAVNQGNACAVGEIKKIVLLFDATGSMGNIWQEAKGGIEKLVERFGEIFPGVKLYMIAFRDYSDGNNILQELNFTANAKELRNFISSIGCFGGDDYPEAVEVALERLLKLKPNLGILVGDAPPHGVVDESNGRTDFQEVARRLGEKQIKVYTVAVNYKRATISSFKEIANLSGGKFFRLEELDELIDLISVAAAENANCLALLQKVMEKEGGGRLTGKQRKLLEAAK